MKLKTATLLIAMISLSCAKKPDDSVETGKSLYVASGACLSGSGNGVPTASNIVYKVSLDNGTPGEIVADYNVIGGTIQSGDTPVGLADIDDNSFYVMLENTNSTGRRVEKIAKTSDHLHTILLTYGSIGAIPGRSLARAADGNLFLGRTTTSIEKYTSFGSRAYSVSTSSWVATASLASTSCASTNYTVSSVQVTPNGRLIFTNYGTTNGSGRVSSIKPTGYIAASDCTSGVATSLSTAWPTASVYLADSHQLLVLYAGSNTASNNYISVYDYDDATGVISNESVAFKDPNIIYGGSAMTLDSQTGKIYVATAVSNSTSIANYNIEQFTYDPTTRLLSRVGTVPFATSWIGSKCISAMFVGK